MKKPLYNEKHDDLTNNENYTSDKITNDYIKKVMKRHLVIKNILIL